MGYAMRLMVAVMVLGLLAGGCAPTGFRLSSDPCAGQTRGACGVQESGPSPSGE